MSINKKFVDVDRRILLSTLWIFVMFNVLYADILSFLNPEFMRGLIETGKAEGTEITSGLLLGSAILLEIPIAMIVLSRVLKYKINRLANIIAAVITILFVIGGGSTKPHYIFLATVETAVLLLIVWLALKWPRIRA